MALIYRTPKAFQLRGCVYYGGKTLKEIREDPLARIKEDYRQLFLRETIGYINNLLP